MKLIKNTLITTVLILFAGNAVADGDEPVNCETTSVQVALYEGWSYCSVEVSGVLYQLSEYIQLTRSSRALLSEYINGSRYECFADVPFSRFGTETIQVCEYTPKAVIKEHNVDAGDGTYEQGVKVVDFESSDRDGYVVSEEVFIDGVSVPNRYHELKVKFGEYSSTYNVTFKVTDDDGNVTETSKNVSVSNLAICQGLGGIDEVCESEN